MFLPRRTKTIINVENYDEMVSGFQLFAEREVSQAPPRLDLLPGGLFERGAALIFVLHH
jgi:hypothetical protein